MPRKPQNTTDQQIGQEDDKIEDADTVQAVKNWWESQVAYNTAVKSVGLKGLEKNLEDAKEKALRMIRVPEDGGKHRFRVQQGNWGTVIVVTPAGEPTDIAFKRVPKPRFLLEGTKVED